MTKRYLALIIEFPDDESLAIFQRGGQNVELGILNAATAAMLVGSGRILTESKAHLHPKIYTTKYHPHAPYVNDVTVNGLRLKP